MALNLSITLKVNSPSSQRIINFLKCLSILSHLPENTLEKAIFQLENIRNDGCQQSLPVQSIDYSNKYSSFPQIASLVGNLEKDYESFGSNYPKTIEMGEKLIDMLHSVALTNNLWWYVPLLNISGDNEIVLEWWNQSKKITIYVSEESIDYIKVWGADMDNEMEDGSISLEDDLTHLWQWIAS